MTLAGTRPPLLSETSLYELHHRARLAIKPGITGMWQESSLNNAILVLFFIMTMIMSIELGTATGIVGTVALLLFLWLNEKNIGFFLNSKSFFVALLARRNA